MIINTLRRSVSNRKQFVASHDTSRSFDASGKRPNRFFSSRITRHRSAGIELAGALLFIGIMAAIGADARNGNAQSTSAAGAAKTTPPSINLQMSQAKTTPSVSAPTDSSAQTANTTPVSTDVSTTTTNTNGNVSTTMTVNGQPVNVPENGTTQKTVTSPSGQTTTITATNNQSTTGNSSNTTFAHTNVSVQSSSVTSTSVGDP